MRNKRTGAEGSGGESFCTPLSSPSGEGGGGDKGSGGCVGGGDKGSGGGRGGEEGEREVADSP